MKKNLILIGGAVVLLGTGVFLFLKNKKKSTTSTENLPDAIASINSSSSSVTTNNVDIKNKEDLVKTVQVLEEAKNIASTIQNKRNEITDFQNKINSIPPKTSTTSIFSSSFNSQKSYYEGRIMNLNKEITNLMNNLKELGYTELNGSPIKIG